MGRRAESLAAFAAPLLPLTTDDRESAAVNARVLWSLLGSKVRAKRMRIEQTTAGFVGTFRGDPHDVSIAQLERHFAGEIALGIMCVANDRARFMAFDIDERGAERVHILGDILIETGFGDAMIATSGSDDDRCKIVVFFARPQPAVAVNRLAFDLLQRARRDADWGLEDLSGKKVCEIRPSLGDGGVLRIGGRHLVRGQRLERFFHPTTGELAYLSRIQPADVTLEVEPEPILVSPQQAWVEEWIKSGRTWTADHGRRAGTNKVRADLMRLAYEAYRLNGAGGRELYRRWVEAIWAASAELHRPSPTTGDPRPVMGWDRRAKDVWSAVVRIRAREKQRATLQLPPPVRSTDVVWQHRLESFAVFVQRRGLNYLAFQCSYRELARFWGCDSKTAWRQVRDFVKAGDLVIVDPGTQGSRGDKTIYALPKHGVDEAYRLADDHHMVAARRAKRRNYEELKARRDAEIAESRRPISINARREKRRKDDARVDGQRDASVMASSVEETQASSPIDVSNGLEGDSNVIPENGAAAASEAVSPRPETVYVSRTSTAPVITPDVSPDTLAEIARRMRARRS